MGSEIRKIPKSKLRKIKEMSPFIIDELMLLGLNLLNNKEVETINNYHYDKRRN